MTSTGPVTSTGHLALAAENIRQAMHVDGPATPPECYDEIGALYEIAAKLEQHLERMGRTLEAIARDPRLRSVDGTAAGLTPEQLALEVRGAAFRVHRVAGEKLRALVRELSTAWTETSGLHFVDDQPADETERCAAEGCGHLRDEHNGQNGRCTNGKQKDTAAWRCDCTGFVPAEPVDDEPVDATIVDDADVDSTQLEDELSRRAGAGPVDDRG